MSGENFSLQWNSHKQNLTSNLKKLFKAQEFVDVTLVSEDFQIRCHRLVLSANSRFFDSILQGTDATYPIVVLPAEIKTWHMQGLVDYMYLGEVTVSKTGLTSFLKSAEMLKIRGLCDVADKFTDCKEEFKAEKKNIEDKIDPIQPESKLPNITKNSPQVVTDASVSINSRDSVNDTNQCIKKTDTQGLPTVYQERGPILNNMQSPRPLEIPDSSGPILNNIGGFMPPLGPPGTPVSSESIVNNIGRYMQTPGQPGTPVSSGPIVNNIGGYMQPPEPPGTPVSSGSIVNNIGRYMQPPGPLGTPVSSGPIVNNIGRYMQPPGPPGTSVSSEPILNNIGGYMQPPGPPGTPVSSGSIVNNIGRHMQPPGPPGTSVSSGPIVNNIGGYMQPQRPPGIPVSSGSIVNNIGGYMQPPRPPETPISQTIAKRPPSMEGTFENQMNRALQETPTSHNLKSMDGNSRHFPGDFENRIHRPTIETPLSHTIAATPPSMEGNSKNVSGFIENPMNRRFPVSDQIIPSEAFEMLRRINTSPSEKRVRLSNLPELRSESPKDFHLGHIFPTTYPKIPPLKKNGVSKSSRRSAKTPPDSQPFQQFNMPGNYGSPPMLLAHSRPPLPPLRPSTSIPHPQFLPHPSIYLHPNLRAFAKNFKM